MWLVMFLLVLTCWILLYVQLWDALPAEMRAPMIKNLVEKLPVKHVAGPEEVAEAYLFLMKCVLLSFSFLSPMSRTAGLTRGGVSVDAVT